MLLGSFVPMQRGLADFISAFSSNFMTTRVKERVDVCRDVENALGVTDMTTNAPFSQRGAEIQTLQ